MLNIQKNIDLSRYTTFKIGGPAEEFVNVTDKDQLLEALRYTDSRSLRFFILGGGSNVIFSDDGFSGLVIRLSDGPKEQSYIQREAEIECWAGDPLFRVVNFAKEAGLAGLECLTGIPGTLGGAVRGNAGAYDLNESGIGSMVEKAEVLDVSNVEYRIAELGKKDCDFSYRSSIFKRSPHLLILSVRLGLKTGDKEKIVLRMKEIIGRRSTEKPKDWVGSAGSFFQNPEVDDPKLIEFFEKETGKKAKDGKIIPAYWLIDEAGMRGKRIGGIQLSEKNPNFVINTGGGTAHDLITLSSMIKMKVRDELGVELKEEICYAGF